MRSRALRRRGALNEISTIGFPDLTLAYWSFGEKRPEEEIVLRVAEDAQRINLCVRQGALRRPSVTRTNHVGKLLPSIYCSK